MVAEPKNIPLKGLFLLPADLDAASVDIRGRFWRQIGAEALRIKREQIRRGIDRWGKRFKPVKRKWGKRTPLMPHGVDSRTYQLLAMSYSAHGATLFWRSGGGRVSWPTILGYHAYQHGPRSLPVRDEIGLSPRSIRTLEGRAFTIWETLKPRKPRPKPKPLLRLAVREDRRQMAEANRLTREAMKEAAEIMTALLALSLGQLFLWDPGEPIE